MRGGQALAALLVAIGAAHAHAAAPVPLSFTVGEDVYTVPPSGLAEVELPEGGGLRFCPTPEVEQEIGAFTARHVDEVVEVKIGETSVFRVQIKTPYASGCIHWPLHPVIAARYRDMLLGTGGN